MAKRLTKDSPHYVNNKDFTEAVAAYARSCREAAERDEEKPQMNDYIGECILRIATRLATKRNFSGYSFKEEMISDGIENVVNYLSNFNAEKIEAAGKKPNAFAYVSQIIWYAFLRRIEKEKKQSVLKDKQLENLGLFAIMAATQDHDDTQYYNQFLEKVLNNSDYAQKRADKAEALNKKKNKKKKSKK